MRCAGLRREDPGGRQRPPSALVVPRRPRAAEMVAEAAARGPRRPLPGPSAKGGTVTAPDPRPYAAPGDLVTAADAAAFVRTYVVDPDTEWDLSDAYNYLERRLDRERRQACRRGCFAMFREACRERDWERVNR